MSVEKYLKLASELIVAKKDSIDFFMNTYGYVKGSAISDDNIYVLLQNYKKPFSLDGGCELVIKFVEDGIAFFSNSNYLNPDASDIVDELARKVLKPKPVYVYETIVNVGSRLFSDSELDFYYKSGRELVSFTYKDGSFVYIFKNVLSDGYRRY